MRPHKRIKAILRLKLEASRQKLTASRHHALPKPYRGLRLKDPKPFLEPILRPSGDGREGSPNCSHPKSFCTDLYMPAWKNPKPDKPKLVRRASAATQVRPWTFHSAGACSTCAAKMPSRWPSCSPSCSTLLAGLSVEGRISSSSAYISRMQYPVNQAACMERRKMDPKIGQLESRSSGQWETFVIRT